MAPLMHEYNYLNYIHTFGHTVITELGRFGQNKQPIKFPKDANQVL